ncbi:hypothetical protein R1flu_014610 [Riccia fluitans]|uniref:Uncharacterized protein n=1 Tax=Riccia fluitans TaxID=41844 RepID=A0ABD1YHQ1_9MARC
MPAGQGLNTSLLVASALAHGGVFYYTPARVTNLPGTTVPSVPLSLVSNVETPVFNFGTRIARPGMTNLGAPGSPMPLPTLFPMPSARNRPTISSVKRQVAMCSPRVNQPSATPFIPMPSTTLGPSLPGYNLWQNVYPGAGIQGIGSPGVSLVAPVSGFPLGPYLVVSGPLATLGEVMLGLLPAPRHDFTQVVNAARSTGKFKGDGTTTTTLRTLSR